MSKKEVLFIKPTILLPKSRIARVLVFLLFALIALAAAVGIFAEVDIALHPSHNDVPLLQAVIWLMAAAAVISASLGWFVAKKRDEGSVLAYATIALGSMTVIGILIVIISSRIS